MAKRKPLRLFVWEEFCPDYTEGIAFAIAENVEQAKWLVREHHQREPFYWGEMQEYDLTKPVAFAVKGGG